MALCRSFPESAGRGRGQARHDDGFSWEQVHTIRNDDRSARCGKPDLGCACLSQESDRKVVEVYGWAERPEPHTAATILKGKRAARFWYCVVGAQLDRLDRAVTSGLSDDARDHAEEDPATAR